MYKETLVKIGLSDGEAAIYEYLLSHGECSASDIIDNTDLKRGNTYNILESLTVKDLIVTTEKNKIAHFKIESPNKLITFIEKGVNEIAEKKTSVENILPALTSKYNITTNKPVTSYYEGSAGFKYILEDVLTSKTEVLQYSDIEYIEKNFKKESDEHIKSRGTRHVQKKLLVVDNAFTRDLYSKLNEEAVSEVRFTKPSKYPIQVSMFIYDNKISYLSLVKDKIIGVIISDRLIYEMHKHYFEELFATSPALSDLSKTA